MRVSIQISFSQKRKILLPKKKKSLYETFIRKSHRILTLLVGPCPCKAQKEPTLSKKGNKPSVMLGLYLYGSRHMFQNSKLKEANPNRRRINLWKTKRETSHFTSRPQTQNTMNYPILPAFPYIPLSLNPTFPS